MRISDWSSDLCSSDLFRSTGKDSRGCAWGQAIGSWGHLGGNGNAARLDRSTGGILMGLDWAGEAMRLGVTGGYSHMKADVDARGSSGKADSYHLGAYAGGQWDGVALRTGLDRKSTRLNSSHYFAP